MWTYFEDTVSAERIALLTRPSSFEEVIDWVCAGKILQCVSEPATSQRLRGCHRPSFLIDVGPQTYDLFFNSVFGYRAQYALSPLQGIAANQNLLAKLLPHLGAYASQLGAIDSIAACLLYDQAKIWIDESEAESQIEDAIPGIRHPPWLDPAGEFFGAGCIAPTGTRLEVKGGWIEPGGNLVRDLNKNRRAEQIHQTGFA